MSLLFESELAGIPGFSNCPLNDQEKGKLTDGERPG
jgi:hypothetical protein